MSKTKEELNELKKEYEELNKKCQELTMEELEQVTGGLDLDVHKFRIKTHAYMYHTSTLK